MAISYLKILNDFKKNIDVIQTLLEWKKPCNDSSIFQIL